MIDIPESVVYFWTDPVNRAAVNVLAGSTEVPADLSLAEVERFELASLAARRIRVEYWALLRALWAASWGEAVRAHLPEAKLLGYGEHLAFTDLDPMADPSVDYAWEEKAACGVFHFAGRGDLFTRLAFVEGESEGELRFYFWDKEETVRISAALDLGVGWTTDGDDRRMTRAGVLTITSDQGQIDPAPFAALAHKAAEALAGGLR